MNELPSSADNLQKDEDIGFGHSNGNRTLVGRSIAIYPGDILIKFSGFCIRYRGKSDVLSADYLLGASSRVLCEKRQAEALTFKTLIDRF